MYYETVNKNAMKKILLFLILAILSLLLVLTIIYNYDQNQHNIHQSEQIDNLYHHIDSVMKHRAHLDSMYWNHLEVCNFQLKEKN
jgi:preprotein translocase subunit SecG